MKVAISDLFAENADGTVHPVTDIQVDGVTFSTNIAFNREDYARFLNQLGKPDLMLEVRQDKSSGVLVLAGK